MAGHMDSGDVNAMTQILRGYQSSHMGWDEYRAKIKHDAQGLLDVWMTVLDECWKNGFMGPEVVGGVIKWRQVLGHDKAADACTMCRQECPELRGPDGFKPCWKATT